MIDDIGVYDLVIGDAVEIDHVGAVAAAGETDVGLARLAWSVDDATDHRQGHGRGDMREPLFEQTHRLDHRKALARARWTRDDRHAAMAQPQRLEDFVAGLDFLDRVGGQRDADCIADAGPQ